jgi:hypothetical protein
MPQPHAHAQYSAAELAWLHTLDGYVDDGRADPAPAGPKPSRAEQLQRRKASNRASASNSREKSKARQAALEARVRDLELAIADLLAQEQLETAENVALALPASTLPTPPGAAGTGGDAPRPE